MTAARVLPVAACAAAIPPVLHGLEGPASVRQLSVQLGQARTLTRRAVALAENEGWVRVDATGDVHLTTMAREQLDEWAADLPPGSEDAPRARGAA